MCFEIKGSKLRKAKEDVVCYKICGVLYDGTIRSISMGFDYQPGVTYSKDSLDITRLRWPRLRLIIDWWLADDWEWGTSEGFHSFTPDMVVGAGNTLWREDLDSTGYSFVRCIIPKGSFYRISKDDTEYLSSAIKMVRVFSMTHKDLCVLKYHGVR